MESYKMTKEEKQNFIIRACMWVLFSCVIPVLFIRFPAKINNGMASIVNDWVVEKAFCTRIVQGNPGVKMKKNSPEIPIANATGIPKNKRTKNNPTAISIISLPNQMIFSINHQLYYVKEFPS